MTLGLGLFSGRWELRADDTMTDPFTSRRAERRAERLAGITLFLLGSAAFALATAYLAHIAGAQMTAVLAAVIR